MIAGPSDESQVQPNRTFEQKMNQNVHKKVLTCLQAFSRGSCLISWRVCTCNPNWHLQALSDIDDEIVSLSACKVLRIVFHIKFCFYEGNVTMGCPLPVFTLLSILYTWHNQLMLHDKTSLNQHMLQARVKRPAKNQKIVRVANKPRTKQAGKKGTNFESKPSAGSKSTADRDSSSASLVRCMLYVFFLSAWKPNLFQNGIGDSEKS